MSNRHLSRTIALQTLFEWDFYHRSKKLFGILERNIHDFAPNFEDDGFTHRLVKGVTKNLTEIDGLIQRFAPEWPLDQITIIDRNILRIGIYELENEKEVPPKVAINESIELAKTFGGMSSHRFVNGVLGSIYSEFIGSKDLNPKTDDEESKEETQKPQEVSAGGLVYRKDSEGNIYFALILDAINKWTFPKGKVGIEAVSGTMQTEADLASETLEETAEREVKEELGISQVEILDNIGSISVTVNPPNKPSYPKIIHYFLMKTDQENLNPEHGISCRDGKWFTEDETLANLGYDNSKQIFKKALKKIKN